MYWRDLNIYSKAFELINYSTQPLNQNVHSKEVIGLKVYVANIKEWTRIVTIHVIKFHVMKAMHTHEKVNNLSIKTCKDLLKKWILAKLFPYAH